MTNVEPDTMVIGPCWVQDFGTFLAVTRECLFTGKDNTMKLDTTVEQLNDYYYGNGYIQDVFPELNADEREFLMTGVHPDTWDDMYGREE